MYLPASVCDAAAALLACLPYPAGLRTVACWSSMPGLLLQLCDQTPLSRRFAHIHPQNSKQLKEYHMREWGVNTDVLLSDTRILDVLLHNSDRHHGALFWHIDAGTVPPTLCSCGCAPVP